ncbi:hypothetical protein ACQ5JZ_00090 [Streptomyces sp. ZG43]
MTELDPDTCSTAREWAASLTHAPRDQPPTVLEKLLLDNGNDPERDVLLHDPVAGTPVLHRQPDTPHAAMLTFSLQRLPTQSQLATLTLSNGTAWVRTDDGTLWLAPERDGYGIGYGYSGTGCLTLARLVDALRRHLRPRCRPGRHPGAARAVRAPAKVRRHHLHPRPADRRPHPYGLSRRRLRGTPNHWACPFI